MIFITNMYGININAWFMFNLGLKIKQIINTITWK